MRPKRQYRPGGHSASAVFVVAAANAPRESKWTSDWVCDGTSDEVVINKALLALPTAGGKIVLTAGTYTLGATIATAMDNVAIQGSGMGTRINLDDSTAVINAATQTGWSITDLDTDLGGVDIATSEYSTARYWKEGFPQVAASHPDSANSTTVLFDDFYEVATGADCITSTALIPLTGTDTVVPAAVAVTGGVVLCTTGDNGAGEDEDGAQVVGRSPWNAAMGNLTMECKVKLNAITTVRAFIGFTDIITLEMPITISTTTVSNVASDVVGFAFDTSATTDKWHATAWANDVVATGVAITDTAPVAGAYQVLRVEIDADGEAARFYIDGVLKASTTANSVTAATSIYPTFIVSTDASANDVRTLSVDYIQVSANRP